MGEVLIGVLRADLAHGFGHRRISMIIFSQTKKKKKKVSLIFSTRRVTNSKKKGVFGLVSWLNTHQKFLPYLVHRFRNIMSKLWVNCQNFDLKSTYFLFFASSEKGDANFVFCVFHNISTTRDSKMIYYIISSAHRAPKQKTFYNSSLLLLFFKYKFIT